MYLDVELCDLEQNVLTRLDDRRGGTYVELGLNSMRRAFCPLSLEDPALELAEAVSTVLRITLRDESSFSRPLFIGRVVIPQDDGEAEKKELGLYASDPRVQLDAALIRAVIAGGWSAVTFTGIDQSEVMWDLVARVSDNGHGVVRGDLDASFARDRLYPPGKEVGPALTEMAELADGPDFELEPIVDTGGTLARLNTFYPRQGSDLSEDVVFVYGARPHTASAYSHSPGGDALCNRALVIGAPQVSEDPLELTEGAPTVHPAFLAEHAASIAEFEGAFEKREQVEDVSDTATLRAHAEALVGAGAFPVDFFDFTATPEQVDGEVGDGVPPVFGKDYWIGDTVGLVVYRGGEWVDNETAYVTPDGESLEPLELAGRVTDAKVTELEPGQLSVKATCAPEVTSAGVTGEALSVVIPEGSE